MRFRHGWHDALQGGRYQAMERSIQPARLSTYLAVGDRGQRLDGALAPNYSRKLLHRHSRTSASVTFLGRVHGVFGHPRRVRVLAEHAARLIPRDAHVLDVGTGDGLLAATLANCRPDIRIEGCDVLVRPNTSHPVE